MAVAAAHHLHEHPHRLQCARDQHDDGEGATHGRPKNARRLVPSVATNRLISRLANESTRATTISEFPFLQSTAQFESAASTRAGRDASAACYRHEKPLAQGVVTSQPPPPRPPPRIRLSGVDRQQVSITIVLLVIVAGLSVWVISRAFAPAADPSPRSAVAADPPPREPIAAGEPSGPPQPPAATTPVRADARSSPEQAEPPRTDRAAPTPERVIAAAPPRVAPIVEPPPSLLPRGNTSDRDVAPRTGNAPPADPAPGEVRAETSVDLAAANLPIYSRDDREDRKSVV